MFTAADHTGQRATGSSQSLIDLDVLTRCMMLKIILVAQNRSTEQQKGVSKHFTICTNVCTVDMFCDTENELIIYKQIFVSCLKPPTTRRQCCDVFSHLTALHLLSCFKYPSLLNNGCMYHQVHTSQSVLTGGGLVLGPSPF